MESKGYIEDAPEVCVNFQLDLSCLVDNELDERAAGGALLHLESCDSCRAFFDDTRHCMRLHLDATDPERLLARISSLTGLVSSNCDNQLIASFSMPAARSASNIISVPPSMSSGSSPMRSRKRR